MTELTNKIKIDHLNDLEFLSAYLQDAILPSSCLYYDPEQENFTLLVNRMCWEKEAEQHEGEVIRSRVHAGVHFCGVKNVRFKSADDIHPEKIHVLLRIHGTENTVQLIFSEGYEILMDVEKILCYISDLHEPYPTIFHPAH